MSDTLPTPEKALVVYEDGANMATILSGGIFFAIILFFIADFFLGTFGLALDWFPYVVAIIVVLISIRMGMTVDTSIKINRKTGWLEIKGKAYNYEGYANEPVNFAVLQKKSVDRRGDEITEYKLSVKVDEETTFDVPLRISEVKMAIQDVETAKQAISAIS